MVTGFSSDVTVPQRGFTLLELLVSMAIFAMLAVAGWQVFDGLSRSREQAQKQVQTLENLQYAYQQIARDMTQTVAYRSPDASVFSASEAGNGTGGNGIGGIDDSRTAQMSNNGQPSQATNGFWLQNNTLSLIRHADPDPRYRTVSQLQRIDYVFEQDALVRRRYQQLGSTTEAVSVDSVVLANISAGQWQVLLPEPSEEYPVASLEASDLMGNAQNQIQQGMSDDQLSDESDAPIQPPASLPKGVAVSFSVTLGNNDTPITWQFALPNEPPQVVAMPQSP